MTRVVKNQELLKIAQEIERCKICKKDKTGVAVVGEGNPNSKIIFIGEAPGKTEALTGRPFVGRSGKFLREQIRTIGLNEEDVYITSPVKYLPVYKTPKDDDIKHGMVHLQKQIEIIDPKVLVLLGSVAARGVLGDKISVAGLHGKSIKKDGKTYFFSYHPAAAIRFVKFRAVFAADFLLLKKTINSIS